MRGLGYYLPIPRPAPKVIRGFAPPQVRGATAVMPAAAQTGYAAPADGAVMQITQLPVQNFMPASGQDFRHTSRSVLLPAIGATAIVVQFKVPQGYNGILDTLANVFVGGGFTDFSGSLIWQLFLDLETGGGIVAPNYDNITASLGSASNPAELHGLFIKENQLVALTVKNVNIAVAGQIVGGLLGGYYYPVDQEPPQTF